jgi:hypothetical protein
MRSASTRATALSWLLAASLLGFGVPALFSWMLHWSRPAFLFPYAVVVGALAVSYLRAHPIPARRWSARLPQVLAAVGIAVFLLWRNIVGQPSSAAPQGFGLVAALAWIGLVYGSIDALLLNVLPVLAVGGPPHAVRGPLQRRLAQGLLCLVASLLVTVAYHAGFVEFQGASMLYAMVGNAIVTATYLASGNPVAPVATHVAMHVLAVLHGMETTLQLPPHYGT